MLAYVCCVCGADGVKLWRPYQTFDIELRCYGCVPNDPPKQYKMPAREFRYDIGWWVCAVPDDVDHPDSGVFCGYTSTPMANLKWWERLPLFVEKVRWWEEKAWW